MTNLPCSTTHFPRPLIDHVERQRTFKKFRTHRLREKEIKSKSNIKDYFIQSLKHAHNIDFRVSFA